MLLYRSSGLGILEGSAAGFQPLVTAVHARMSDQTLNLTAEDGGFLTLTYFYSLFINADTVGHQVTKVFFLLVAARLQFCFWKFSFSLKVEDHVFHYFQFERLFIMVF